MTTNTKRNSHGLQFTSEGAGWITCRRPAKAKSLDAFDLLTGSAEPRPCNVRFAIEGGQVVQLGEVRDVDGLLTADAANELLREALEHDATTDANTDIAADELACLLGETGIEWTPSEDENDATWNAAVNDATGHRCELNVHPLQGGVEVAGRIVEWAGDLNSASRAAIARFLITAHASLRFVRFKLQSDGVIAASFAYAGRLEIELPESIAAVVTASGQVRRELVALQDESIATQYVEATG